MSNAAVIFGSTGLVGGFLVDELSSQELHPEIILPVRKFTGKTGLGIMEVEVDFKNLNPEDFPKHAAIYCAIGTTRSKTPDLSKYHAIDVEIPVAVAFLAAALEAKSLVVVSAVDANENSNNFYLKMKGEMERRVGEVFPKAYFVRPAMLRGPRKEFRLAELVFRNIAPVFDLVLFGKLNRYKSIKARDVARAMIRLAESGYKEHVIQAPEIHQLARSLEQSSLSDT